MKIRYLAGMIITSLSKKIVTKKLIKISSKIADSLNTTSATTDFPKRNTELF